jgi:hypothetical protein
MLSRRKWVTQFIGYVLRRSLPDDPDWAFDTAGETYAEWNEVDPGVAAYSAFSPDVLQGYSH